MADTAIYKKYPLFKDFDALGDSILEAAPGSDEETLLLKALGEAFRKEVQTKPIEVIYCAEELRFAAAKKSRGNLMLLSCDWVLQGAKVQTDRLWSGDFGENENLFGASFNLKKMAQSCWELKDEPMAPGADRSMKDLADEAVDTWGRFLAAWQKCDRKSVKECEERNFWINMDIPDSMEFSSRLRQHLSAKVRFFGHAERRESPMRRLLKNPFQPKSNIP